jgi:hypothetical protein
MAFPDLEETAMNSWKTYALATSVTVFGGLAASAAMEHRTAHAAHTQGVTIDGPLPLPVSGTVTAQQGGPWNVGLLGTPSVNIANSPSVSLSNSAAQPLFFVNVGEPGRSPYQYFAVVPVPGCSGSSRESCRLNTPVVPGGKRLVVEHITGLVQFDRVPAQVNISVSYQSGGQILSFDLQNLAVANSFERSVLFYIDGNQSYGFSVLGDLNSNYAAGATQAFGATGYLIDCNVAPCAPIGP